MSKQGGLSFYKRRKKISAKTIREILSWLFGILTAVFFAVVLVYLFGMTTNVVGVSMMPGLQAEQGIMVDRFRYVLTQPKRGDVVLFLPNGNENSHYYTKRVVARPGDTIIIENGVCYVNGTPSEYVTEKVYDAGIASSEMTLKTGEYFVLGDDPSSSEDSRSANIGPVQEKYIVGKVWLALRQGESKMHFVK
ncbi:MAG: signal peptidase I [Lachnospiraceae bacterium]|nr:signal peptidase I [Lachnospiraceae bacterium]